jgi:hypothetical protein
MNVGEITTQKLMQAISDANSKRIQEDSLSLSYSFFIIWNDANDDYLQIHVDIKQFKNNIHNDEYDICQDIDDKMHDFMNSKINTRKESFPFFIPDYNKLYTVSILFDRIKKNSIIRAHERPRLKRFIDQEIISMIQDAGETGLSASELNQRTQCLTKKERNDIIKELLDKEIISLIFDTSRGRKKKIYRYD